MASRFDSKRELLKNIVESLQCYKCKAVPGPTEEQKNRYSCLDNSHELCEDCKAACECGSVVGQFPSSTIKQILKDLPMCCQHYKDGCRQIFEKDEDLEGHQIGCIFRAVYCPWVNCKVGKIIFKDIADHSSEEHFDFSRKEAKKLKLIATFDKTETYSHVFGMPLFNKKDRLYAGWSRKIVINGQNDFFLVGNVVNNIMHFWVYIFGSPHEAKNYACTLSVNGKNGNKFTYYDYVKPLDEGSADIIAKQSLFMIGTEIAKNSRDENLEWQMEVTIHALKEEAKDKDEESGVEDGSD